MAFPLSPTVGSTYTTSRGFTYQYTADGTWRLLSASSGSGVVLPANAAGSLLNDGVGALSWSGSRSPVTATGAALAAPSAGLGANGDVAISGQATDGKTAAIYNKVSGVWTQADVRGPNGGNVFTNSSATMLAPAVGLGQNGDMALSYNTAGTQYKSYNKVSGAWVQSSLLTTTGGTILAAIDNSLSAPAGGIGFDGDTAVVSNTAGTASKLYTKRAGAWVASSFAPGIGGETYALTDNTLSTPSAVLGADGDQAVVTNTAGTSGKIFAKRAGVWAQVTNVGAGSGFSAVGTPVAFSGVFFPGTGTAGTMLEFDMGFGGVQPGDIITISALGGGFTNGIIKLSSIICVSANLVRFTYFANPGGGTVCNGTLKWYRP